MIREWLGEGAYVEMNTYRYNIVMVRNREIGRYKTKHSLLGVYVDMNARYIDNLQNCYGKKQIDTKLNLSD